MWGFPLVCCVKTVFVGFFNKYTQKVVHEKYFANLCNASGAGLHVTFVVPITLSTQMIIIISVMAPNEPSAKNHK